LKIAVFNTLIGLAGGGEKVALSIARAFEEAGHEVHLFTYPDKSRSIDEAIKILGSYRSRDIVVLNTPKLVRLLGVGGRFVRYRRLLLVKNFLDMIKGEKYDLVVDTSSNAPTAVDISYIHFPATLGVGEGFRWRGYEWLVNRLLKKVVGDTRLVLTNSSWTLNLFRKVWGDNYKAEVLHPPVDVDFFSRCEGSSKENIIATVSRYSLEKRLWELVRILRDLKGYKLVFTGSSHRHSFSDYVIKRIKEEAERYNVRDRVEILIDVSREDLRRILCKASFYVHPPFAEHFGISIVEAMSAGCVPIVYRDGGGWTDIVSKIDERLGYVNVNDILRIIHWVEAENMFDYLSKISKERSKKYSYERFRERLLRMVSQLWS
jgi:glycosyltransferase involved in cell wall biosynthesis